MSDFLELDQISLAYDTPDGLASVVQSLSLSLEKGGIGCLLGASGCGKTTVLRAIAGFEHLRAGSLSLGDAYLSEVGRQLATERRNVSTMFQDYALFPHLPVGK